jgi:perosamine synthetase
MSELPTAANRRSQHLRSRIPVAAPVLDGRETVYVMECMETSWISSTGRFVAEFEKAFAELCEVRHAIATCNGTTALHLALVALDLSADDEVIVPTLTYIASANAVRYCNATPVFVDNDERTFNLDASLIEAKLTPRTKAIIPVHLYGHPVDMAPVTEIAKKHQLFVVEDAAEAVGARYHGRPVGGLGTCGVFSFFGNKIITTGEGGMVTTNDDDLAARLRLLRGQGMDLERRYWFPVVGYNYRMTNIAAAIGLGQIERVKHHLARRKAVARGYNERLWALRDHIILPTSENWAEHVYWMYTIMLRTGGEAERDLLMVWLDAAGIETRPVFYPLHLMPPYQSYGEGSYPKAELCASRGINLPSHGLLTDTDLDRIAESLESFFTAARPRR